jgi:hypothetical protein
MSLGFVLGKAYQDKGPCEARAKHWAWFQRIPWPRALLSLKTHSNLEKNFYRQTSFYNDAFTLDVKSVLNENLGHILTQC